RAPARGRRAGLPAGPPRRAPSAPGPRRLRPGRAGRGRFPGGVGMKAVAGTSRALVRELDGEAVLLDLDSGMYYGLNSVGTWIWNRTSAAGSLAFETLVDELVAEFDVDRPVAEGEAAAFIDELRANRLADV